MVSCLINYINNACAKICPNWDQLTWLPYIQGKGLVSIQQPIGTKYDGNSNPTHLLYYAEIPNSIVSRRCRREMYSCHYVLFIQLCATRSWSANTHMPEPGVHVISSVVYKCHSILQSKHQGTHIWDSQSPSIVKVGANGQQSWTRVVRIHTW